MDIAGTGITDWSLARRIMLAHSLGGELRFFPLGKNLLFAVDMPFYEPMKVKSTHVFPDLIWREPYPLTQIDFCHPCYISVAAGHVKL